VNEGQSVSFTVDTINVPSGTVLHWTTQSLTGTVATGDFTDNLTSGTITINNNTASITRTLREDFATEGAESFAIQIRTGSASGPVVVTSATVSINDTSVPTYSVTPDVSSVNEGGTVTFTVNTQGVANGTTLFWTTTGTNVNSSDFSDSAVVGSFTINSSTGSFTRTLANDATTEGTESFAIQIRTGSTSGTVVATSSSVTVNDTSLTPTYSITPNTTSVSEGGGVVFTVTTTNVANGTTLFWSTTGTNVTNSDFTDAAVSGTITINNGSATITRTLANDATTEGTESFQIQVRTGSTGGTVVATSSSVTINDTSLTLPGQVTFTIADQWDLNDDSQTNDEFRTFFWTVPGGVTSVSVVCVGGGGGGRGFNAFSLYAGGGGGGGALTYTNNIPVTPGQVFRIDVGKGGSSLLTPDSNVSQTAWPGGDSWFYAHTGNFISPVAAQGGRAGRHTGSAAGGNANWGQGGPGTVKFSGGAGGTTQTSGTRFPSGGGGAAGYNGNGGAGGERISTTAVNGASGIGGSGGGGGALITQSTTASAGRGGGVGLTGLGSNGAGGISGAPGTVTNGGPGSGGSGASYGGGGGGFISNSLGIGAAGAVRIMWPGDLRQYPSTRTADE
jgi:hypothetical protein